jgi:hypothetical protein
MDADTRDHWRAFAAAFPGLATSPEEARRSRAPVPGTEDDECPHMLVCDLYLAHLTEWRLNR